MGILYVVGIGPGGAEFMTAEARNVLDQAEALFGYSLYADLIAPLYPDKAITTTPMTQETERCQMALELSPAYPGVDVRIVPGVTAALSGAARLGAPLGHDFCVISLSDLLTPWETIETRLRCAAEGDFAVCLYNPASRRRRDHLRRGGSRRGFLWHGRLTYAGRRRWRDGRRWRGGRRGRGFRHQAADLFIGKRERHSVFRDNFQSVFEVVVHYRSAGHFVRSRKRQCDLCANWQRREFFRDKF